MAVSLNQLGKARAAWRPKRRPDLDTAGPPRHLEGSTIRVALGFLGEVAAARAGWQCQRLPYPFDADLLEGNEPPVTKPK